MTAFLVESRILMASRAVPPGFGTSQRTVVLQ
jgi:hypothetical protein